MRSEMAREAESPDDVSAMMEKLWGPRTEGPIDAVTAGRRDRAPETDERGERTGLPEADDQASLAAADLVELMDARQTETIERARSELNALRSDIDAAIVDVGTQVAGARDEAVAAADARVAGAETRLLSRLDEIAAGVAQVAERSTVGDEVLARIDVVERETTERWAAIEQRVGPELQALTQAVESVRVESVSSADLDTVRTEGAAGVNALAEQIAEAVSGVTVLSSSVDSALSRVERLEEETAKPEPGRFDPVGLRSELEADVAAMLQAERTEMQRGFTEALGQLAERMAAEQSELRDALEAQVGQLQAAIEAGSERAGAAVDRADRAGTDVARVLSANEDLGRAQGATSQRLEQLAERLEQLQATAEAERGRLAETLASQRSEFQESLRADLAEQLADAITGVTAVSSSVDSALSRVERLEEAMAKPEPALLDPVRLRSEVEAGVAAMLQAERTETERSVTRVVDQLAELIAAEQSELQAALEAQARQLQAAIDAETERAGAAVDRADRAGADVDRMISANEELGRAQGDASQRLDQLAERLEQSLATADAERGELAETLASQRSELQESLRANLTDPQPAGVAGDEGRLQALEGGISELGDYHAALDAGLGALRTEIEELRDALRKMARDHEELLDRAEAPVQVAPSEAPDQGRGRRAGRKADTGAQIATVLSVTEGLVGEHHQLKADLARLEQEVRAAASTTPALAPLRSDLRRLRDQVAEQNEALESLRAVVEGMPKRASSRSPAAKRTPRPTKD